MVRKKYVIVMNLLSNVNTALSLMRAWHDCVPQLPLFSVCSSPVVLLTTAHYQTQLAGSRSHRRLRPPPTAETSYFYQQEMKTECSMSNIICLCSLSPHSVIVKSSRTFS